MIRILITSKHFGHLYIHWMNNKRKDFYFFVQDQIEFQLED